MEYENEELLTPKELIEAYNLEEGEDLQKFVRKINKLSKGTKIRLIEESKGSDLDEN